MVFYTISRSSNVPTSKKKKTAPRETQVLKFLEQIYKYWIAYKYIQFLICFTSTVEQDNIRWTAFLLLFLFNSFWKCKICDFHVMK